VDTLSRRYAAENPVVARFRERVLAALGDGIERIVLFGSRARGDEHAESDWDFAVFFDHDPGEREQRTLSDVTCAVQREFATRIQSIARSGQVWLATDELSCNIRDHGRVAYGPPEIPMIERPVLQHARAAMDKAARFAEQADHALPQPTKPSFKTATTRCSMRGARRCSRSRARPAPITAGRSKPSRQR
jgi:predicted nucleotidyltransferase